MESKMVAVEVVSLTARVVISRVSAMFGVEHREEARLFFETS